MLMEAILIKSLFTKPQASPITGEKACTTTAHLSLTSNLKKGAATWTREGEWIKGSSSQKIRLMLADNPQTYVAVQDNGPNKGFYQRIRDHFTHVSVATTREDGTKDFISLNIGSLGKRVQLSVATILLMWITGRLTFEYIDQCARKAHESNQLFDRIIENGRARALEVGQNPDDKASELKDVLRTVFKSRRLSKGILAQKGETTYIAHKDEKNRFTLEEKKALLGEGSYGIVYEVLNLGTGEAQAVKFAKKADKKSGIKNENAILSRVHKNGHVNGIQDAPDFVIDLLQPELGVGYVTTKYDHTLNDLDFLKLTPMAEKLIRAKDLFHGLYWLHKENIVHCDIKPANCCSADGELQIADFGHARLRENVTPEQVLGVCTPYFTSESDQRENKRITLAYCMHQIAIGKVKNPIATAWILQSAVEHPTFNIDRPAAKFTIASLLMKFTKEKLTAMGIATDLYKTEMETLRKHPETGKSRGLKLEKFKLTAPQMDQLKNESFALCKRHDVYGLAVTLVCIYLGHRYITPRALASAIAKLTKDPELNGVNPGLPKLLKEMMNKDAAKRPSIKEAMDRYNDLLKNCPNQTTPVADAA